VEMLHLGGVANCLFHVTNPKRHRVLFNDQLNGMIPMTVGGMEDLRDFHIYNNQIEGPIPSEISNCFQLEKIEIQDNPIGYFTSLAYIIVRK
jgi:ribosomal protein L13